MLNYPKWLLDGVDAGVYTNVKGIYYFQKLLFSNE